MVKIEWMEALRLMDDRQLEALISAAKQEMQLRKTIRRIGVGKEPGGDTQGGVN